MTERRTGLCAAKCGRKVNYTEFCPVCYRKLPEQTQKVIRQFNNKHHGHIDRYAYRLAMKAAVAQLTETGNVEVN